TTNATGATGLTGTTDATCATGLTGTTNATCATGLTGTAGATNSTWPITCTPAISGSAGTLTTELVCGSSVAIRSISAVLRIVLPITLPALTPVDGAIEIVVLIKVIVVVDVDVAAVPIAIAPVAAPRTPSDGTERNSRAPHQSRPGHITRIGVGIIRVFHRSRAVHHSRIVRGHINNIRVRLLNFDHLLAAGDSLGSHYGLGTGF